MSVSLAVPLLGRELKVSEIILSGDSGSSDTTALRKTLKQMMREGYRILVIDLGDVVDVDRGSWDCLVSAARQLRREGGSIILRHCPPALFAQLQAYRWEQCFALPEHRPADMAALPSPLRGWLGGSES